MIQFRDVTFKHQYDDFALLENASFTLCDGINTLLCDIQSGKSTICKLILGELQPQCGEIIIDDRRFSSKEHADVLYLPRTPDFFNNRSVLFNLQYPSKVRKILPQNEQRILQLAKTFGFEQKLNVKVKKLSQSEKRNLSLARGLTVERKTVLFDDFFDNTSSVSITELLQLFPFCKTIVVLTSDARFACGHTVVLDGKQCVFQGDSDGAKKIVQSLCWLNEKLK